MIEIKIPELYYSEDANQPAIKRPPVDIFIDGLNELCKKTGMTRLGYSTIFGSVIPTYLKFEDGCTIGTRALFERIGFLKDVVSNK